MFARKNKLQGELPLDEPVGTLKKITDSVGSFANEHLTKEKWDSEYKPQLTEMWQDGCQYAKDNPADVLLAFMAYQIWEQGGDIHDIADHTQVSAICDVDAFYDRG
tara:strand:- start:45 stop:362 length:318 start_codon:yes stop_codon:yes gene_type:complete